MVKCLTGLFFHSITSILGYSVLLTAQKLSFGEGLSRLKMCKREPATNILLGHKLRTTNCRRKGWTIIREGKAMITKRRDAKWRPGALVGNG